MIRLLRVARESRLLTAQVYEELFERQFSTTFAVRRAPLREWCESVLGPPGSDWNTAESARRFAAATADVDFLCPNYECIPLAPLLLALRNRAGASVRLLFISHAAGSYFMEWALLRPLIAAGDVIVAPSPSAARAITQLCPALAPNISVIAHPMAPLGTPSAEPTARSDARPRIVSLGRVHARKLIHRQIEAMAVLRDRGRTLPLMEIAGPLDDGGWSGPHPYTLSLQEKVKRLHLENDVRLVGAVRGDANKAAFLSGASMLINLSVTLEESFPKTPVEALGAGVPVLGTEWNGIRDTVGACGVLLPVSFVGHGLGTADVDAASVANGIERLLAEPPSADACRAQVASFRPEIVLPRYRRVLHAALAAREDEAAPRVSWPAPSAPAAPDAGLLAMAAPLTHLSYHELFHLYAMHCDTVRASWTSDAIAPMVPSAWVRVSAMVEQAIEAPMERAAAGHAPLVATRDPAWSLSASVVSAPEAGHSISALSEAELLERFTLAATARTLTGGRVFAVALLLQAGRRDAALRIIAQLDADSLAGVATDSLLAEARSLGGEHERALRQCLASLESSPPGEAAPIRVRQLARIARQLGRPALALPWLDRWLAEYPDAQESGPVWLDRCISALTSDGDAYATAEHSLQRAHALLGPQPVVEKARRLVAARVGQLSLA